MKSTNSYEFKNKNNETMLITNTFDNVSLEGEINVFALQDKTNPIAKLNYFIFNENNLQLDRIGVNSNYKQLGIGFAMVTLLETFAKQKNIILINGWMNNIINNANMQKAVVTRVAFYKSLGYQIKSEKYKSFYSFYKNNNQFLSLEKQQQLKFNACNINKK